MIRGVCLTALIFALVFVHVFESKGVETMELSSSAFKNGGKISVQYVMSGAGGKNISIPLNWKNPPGGTKSFALSIVDPHPVAKNWVHWLVINIPPNTTSLEEGASKRNMPPGSVELKNSFGDTGYGGPQPPTGTGDHPYVATVYALSVQKLDLRTNVSLAQFMSALDGKVLAEASTTGYFGR